MQDFQHKLFKEFKHVKQVRPILILLFIPLLPFLLILALLLLLVILTRNLLETFYMLFPSALLVFLLHSTKVVTIVSHVLDVIPGKEKDAEAMRLEWRKEMKDK